MEIHREKMAKEGIKQKKSSGRQYFDREKDLSGGMIDMDRFK